MGSEVTYRLQKKTEQFLESTEQYERDDFREQYAKHVSPTVTSLYIDLPMLQDIYLGGLLHMTMDDPAALTHIVNRLEAYHNRYTEDHASCFPALGITEEQLLAFVTDPANASELLLKSPPTTFWTSLRNLHTSIKKDNKVVDGVAAPAPEKIRYLVNTYPLEPSVNLAKWFKLKFCIGIDEDSLSFGALSAPSWNLVPNEYPANDYYFLYQFNRWMEDTTTNGFKAMCGGKLHNSRIFAYPKVIDPVMIDKLRTAQYTEFVELERFYMVAASAYTTLQFYRPLVTGFEAMQ